jgi:hypothetical protein
MVKAYVPEKYINDPMGNIIKPAVNYQKKLIEK